MFGRNTASLVLATAFLFSGNVSADCAYTPFDMDLTQSGKAKLDFYSNHDLRFAQTTAVDATTVWSEPPFYRQNTKVGPFKYTHKVWTLDPKTSLEDTKHDSDLASQNTMLEIYGQVAPPTANKQSPKLDPKWFLTRENMLKLAGLSSSDFAAYPKGANAAALRDKVRNVFGADADGVLADLERRNNSAQKQNLVHYARPSYLSSDENSPSSSLSLLCLTASYTSSIYQDDRRSETSRQRQEGFNIAPAVFSSSVNDRLAAEFLLQASKGKKVEDVVVSLANGKAQCKLKRDFRYFLRPNTDASSQACSAVDQTVPVVRNGPDTEKDQRLIQIGDKVYNAICYLGGTREWINFSDRSARPATAITHLMQALAEDPAVKKSGIGEQLGANLDYLLHPNDDKKEDPKSSFAFFRDTAKKCDALLNSEVKHEPKAKLEFNSFGKDIAKTTAERRRARQAADRNSQSHW